MGKRNLMSRRPRRRRITRSWRRSISSAIAIVPVAMALLTAGSLWAQGPGGIQGRVVNGTSGEAASEGLEVALHVVGDGGETYSEIAVTNTQGLVHFDSAPQGPGFTYFLAATYAEVNYDSGPINPEEDPGPLDLTVYETTDSLENVGVNTHVLLISEGDRDERYVSVVEFVGLVNAGDHTFVPDLSRPGEMRFLRLPVAAGAAGLQVDSDLPAGQVIDVGTGFAIDGPVTPGNHQMIYRYRAHYAGDTLDLRRTLHLGAGSFRLLVESSLGNAIASDDLSPLDVVPVDDVSYSAWEAVDLAPGSPLNMGLEGLPQPPLFRRLGDSLSDGPYLKVGIPAAAGLALAAMLAYAVGPWRRRSIVGAPDARESLVGQIVSLDEANRVGTVRGDEYGARRAELKSRLLALAEAPGITKP